MRANRLIHALTISTPGGHFWDDVYSRVPEQSIGIPFNILLTYYYVRICSKYKTPKQQADIVRNHRRITNGGIILIDSGVYSLNVRHGVNIRSYNIETTRGGLDSIAEEGKGLLDLYTNYVDEYAEFLAASKDYWDYAFDFDADIFLGSSITDMLHERLISQGGLDRKRLIRVYHIARPDVNTWWRDLCEDDRYEYIAIEGGTTHRRDPTFYNPLIALAHTHGKRVHILAVSAPRFTQRVAVDTFDCTSHLSGGRFGSLLTPWGAVDFSRDGIKPPAYKDLSTHVRSDLHDYLADLGLTIDEIISSPYSRNLANIWFMNKYWDVAYAEEAQSLSLFDILGAK